MKVSLTAVVSANIIGKGNPFDTIEDLKEIHQQKIANGNYLMLISAVNPTAQKSSPPEGGELLCIKLV
ncbi:MAG: hypothetical protein EGQ60_00115 [Clostridiales bacterium]|nr:hypothetical protein [Clostridiales bacterium]